jgi:hypothetical protein
MSQFIAHQGIYLLSHSVGLPLVGAEQAASSAFGSHGRVVMAIYGITG